MLPEVFGIMVLVLVSTGFVVFGAEATVTEVAVGVVEDLDFSFFVFFFVVFCLAVNFRSFFGMAEMKFGVSFALLGSSKLDSGVEATC